MPHHLSSPAHRRPEEKEEQEKPTGTPRRSKFEAASWKIESNNWFKRLMELGTFRESSIERSVQFNSRYPGRINHIYLLLMVMSDPSSGSSTNRSIQSQVLICSSGTRDVICPCTIHPTSMYPSHTTKLRQLCGERLHFCPWAAIIIIIIIIHFPGLVVGTTY